MTSVSSVISSIHFQTIFKHIHVRISGLDTSIQEYIQSEDFRTYLESDILNEFIKELGNKLVSKQRKRVKDMPVGPRNCYIYYCKENRPILKSKYPTIAPKDISKRLGIDWKLMKTDKKNKWIQMAIKDKERYAKDIEKYKLLANTELKKSKSPKKKSKSPKKKAKKLDSMSGNKMTPLMIYSRVRTIQLNKYKCKFEKEWDKEYNSQTISSIINHEWDELSYDELEPWINMSIRFEKKNKYNY